MDSLASSGMHAWPSRRRHRTSPPPGASLAVPNPQIAEILDTQTGEHEPVLDVIGTDYYELMQLRMRVRTAMHADTPLYRCSICGVPVYICCSQKEIRFFFKHRHEDGNCPAITRGTLTQDEINARKYNGAKESLLHRKMKDWLVECMLVDGRFEAIEQEKTWKGALTGEWRRPDVRATYNGIPIAFEVQLSTTYLNVIAERRQFYLAQGGLLFWVFAVFESNHRRMTEDDVFYNNNQNAFTVSPKTVQESLATRDFMLECIWAEPTPAGGTSALHRRIVPFHQLTLDPATQRAYLYDFDGRRQQLLDLEHAEKQALRDEFEAWWGITGYYGPDADPQWVAFTKRFRRHGIALPRYVSDLDKNTLTALYSAKNNRPWGQGKKKLVELAHHLSNSRKDLVKWFMHGVRKYGRLETMAAEGDPRKWKVRYDALLQEHKAAPAAFIPSRKHLDLVEFLFPELLPLP